MLVVSIARLSDWPRLYPSLRDWGRWDVWSLGLAAKISHLFKLGTGLAETGTGLAGACGDRDVKDADAGGQGEPRRLVLLAPMKENPIESPLNVATLKSDVWPGSTGEKR